MLKSINPATGVLISEFHEYTPSKVSLLIDLSQTTFNSWSQTNFATRTSLLNNVANILRQNREQLASVITAEVGKRISESLAEVDKCALVCEYFASNSEKFLAPETITTEAHSSQVIFEPLGIILAIMPWNFPLWQVFRCAAPAIMAGNSVLLKHASNVPQSALAIEKIFIDAGAPLGLFQTLLISSSQISSVIADDRVRLISLTGSEDAGSQVASLAGKNIKKTILELGGSDPFIVMADADLDKAVATAVSSRLIVAGQSCIAAKRFFVEHSIYPDFLEKFTSAMSSKKVGDPTNPATEVGPLSSHSILQTIDSQVKKSIAMGAKLHTGGARLDMPGFFYPPTVLSNITVDMPVFFEETFGPVATVMPFSTIEEAIELANNSRFGLGASVWASNTASINEFTAKLHAGSVFVNSLVKSDPRLPFGGTRLSGYGRELSRFGLLEFTNIKTVWIE